MAGDEVIYNTVARGIMPAHNIAVNDLHEQTTTFAGTFSTAPQDVHFTPEGYARLAKQVAASIRSHLTP